MPRIGRGNPANSPSHEQTGNATPPRSPDPAGGSATGRRERHGLLGMLRRPFRGSGSSAHASGNPSASPQHEHEQASASRAAPRNAAALLQRSPALSRSHAEEVMARLERAPAETPGRSTDGLPSRSRAQGALTPQPGRRAAGGTHAAQAAAITQQLRDAGVDLSRVRRNVLASMQGHPVNFDRQALRVLNHHFPNMYQVGLGGNPLAAALHDHLAAETSESRAGSSSRTTQAAPSRSPARGALTPQPARPSPHEAQAARIVDELRNAGIDLPTVRRSLSTLLHRGRIDMNRRTVGILMPHFPNLLGGLQANDPLAAALDRALELQTSQGQIRSAYGDLRAISRETAKSLGFKDAAMHGEDDATQCMFGGALSTGNPNQLVIALARAPSDPRHAFDAGVNKEVEFMDLAALAKYLETKPQHPATRQPLDASNIRNYAFRIE